MHITQQEKEKFLLEFDEDGFRDRVVRRLFKAIGFGDGRDLCGPEEYGKDAIFVEKDRFGEQEFVAVQTKVGHVNLSGDPSKNLHSILAQITTALNHPYVCIKSKQRKLPRTVYLASSGKMNSAAREYISNSVNDPRIKFLDRDDLIARIDDIAPEIWSGIVSDISPYLRALAEKIESLSVSITDVNPIQSSIGAFIAASDTRFVDVRLGHHVQTLTNRSGKVINDFKFEEIKGSSLFSAGSVRALLLGEAGSGKSTLLVRLAYMIAKSAVVATKNYRVPIIVRAYDLVGKDGSHFDILSKLVLENHNLSKSPFDLDDLEEGRVILMVDGLDELFRSEDRQAAIDFCLAFCDLYPKCSLALTTRPYSSIEKLAGLERFKRYRISSLSMEDAGKMLEVVERRSGKSDPLWRKEILRRLDGVHGFDLNPLLVTVFAVSAGFDKRDIPANITELFEKFTELMLGRWDEKKGLSQQYQHRVKDKLVSDFAYKLHMEGRSDFSRSDFIEFSKEILQSIHLVADLDVMVSEILDRSGLFRGDSTLEFRHHLLQEYFASRGIPDVSHVRKVISHDWWRNVVVFYFGGKPDSVQDLLDLATSSDVPEDSSFIAVGLALQACYLSKIEDRIEVWKWVNGMAAKATVKWFADDWSSQKYPVTSAISEYLEAREALPLNGLSNPEFTLKEWCASTETDADRELRLFWLAVGLAELNEFDELKKLIDSNLITRPLLLTAIHFGCFFAEKIKVMSDSQAQAARKICSDLDSKVAVMRHQVTREFRGQLLEYRKGGVVALDEQEVVDDVEDIE